MDFKKIFDSNIESILNFDEKNEFSIPKYDENQKLELPNFTFLLLEGSSTMKEVIENLKILYSSFSLEELSFYLFVIFSSPNNRSCLFKRHIIYQSLSSMSKKDFSLERKTNNYRSLKICFKNLKKIILKLEKTFPMMEDYVPICDTGEIKYFYENHYYPVFYDGAFTLQYEYYEMFNIMFNHDKKSKNDFLNILKFQEEIIKQISNSNDKINENIQPGHFELPSLKHYNSINKKSFFNSFDLDKRLCKNLSIELDQEVNYDLMEHSFFTDEKLGSFLRDGDIYFPIYTSEHIVSLFNLYKKYPQDKKSKLGLANFFYERGFGKDISLITEILGVEDQNIKGNYHYDAAFSVNETLYLFLLKPNEDLGEISKKLKKDKNLFLNYNCGLFSHWDIESKKGNFRIPKFKIKKIEFIIILPDVNKSYNIKNCKEELMYLRDLIYIFEEIEDITEFDDYMNFFKKYKSSVSTIDRINFFSSFKESSGELVKGAEEFNKIFIPTGDTAIFRYESLKKYWQLAKEIPYGNPGWWKIKEEDGIYMMINQIHNDFSTKIYIENKSIRTSIIKMDEKTDKELKVEMLIFDMINYTLEKNKQKLRELKYFSLEGNILIKIVSNKLLKNKRWEHLKHLSTEEKKLRSDHCYFNDKEEGVRIVYDFDYYYDALQYSKNKKLENDLLREVLKHSLSRNEIKSLEKILLTTDNDKTGFGLDFMETPVQFDSTINKIKVENKHYTEARKDMAKLLKQKDIRAGDYKGKKAREVLLEMGNILVREFQKQLFYKDEKLLIEITLGKIESELYHEHISRAKYENDKERLKDYDSLKYITENDAEFKRNINTLTFILENKLYSKTTQNKAEDNINICTLFAYAKWIVDIYNSVDELMYSLNSELKLILHENYLYQIELDKDTKEKRAKWSEYMTTSQYEGNDITNVLSKDEMQIIKEKINIAFFEFYGFKFDDISLLLDVFYKFDMNNEMYYILTKEEILKYFLENFPKISSVRIKKALDYLVLKPEGLGCILKNKTLEEKGFIPYGEINKRPYRLNAKPIIKIEGKYFIGRYLCRRAFSVLTRHFVTGKLPYRSESDNIQKVMDEYAKLIQDKIVEEGERILLENTFSRENVFKEANLQKIDRSGNHPDLNQLGDYDLLVFDEENSRILNIECKYITQAYCGKDMKNDIEDLYGNKRKKGYIHQVQRREEYLKIVGKSLSKNLGFDFKKDPKIVSIFLSYTIHYFEKFPPIDTRIIFLNLDEFKKYISIN